MNEKEFQEWGKKYKEIFICGTEKLTLKQKEELWNYIRWQLDQDEKKKETK